MTQTADDLNLRDMKLQLRLSDFSAQYLIRDPHRRLCWLYEVQPKARIQIFCVIFILFVIICEDFYKRSTVHMLIYPERICCALDKLRFSVTFILKTGCVLPNYIKFVTNITCLNIFQK
jgi:hypothetical protein